MFDSIIRVNCRQSNSLTWNGALEKMFAISRLLFIYVTIISAQEQSCNYTACLDTRELPWSALFTCGTVVSEDPVQGVKCAHITKSRGPLFYNLRLYGVA